MVYNWPLFIQRSIYPSRCLLCGGAGDNARDIDLCPACRKELPHNSHYCYRCALPLPSSVPAGSLCGACLQRRLPFERTIAPLIYQHPVADLIAGLKFHARLQYGRMLSTLLLEQILDSTPTEMPQLLIPVPLHRKRLRERGYNQAVELARPLGRQLDIPIDLSSCRRIRATSSQSALHIKERRSNVRGAFELSKEIAADHVALLDDVVTTGNTVAELARVLRRGGVKRVDVWALARTAY